MLGTLVYMILDVSFNVLLWSSQKAIEGSNVLGNKIIKTYNELNKQQILMIEETTDSINKEYEEQSQEHQEHQEPPSYNNTLQSISIEDIKTIKKQIECQSKMINELELILENQQKKI
uniref:Uncharacterized protein n=1 Tax=viral metagenome TaxID=1070528 RepID=A0A6C0EFJ7_9ZZZZ